MNGIGLFIAICFFITFGPPVLFFVIGLVKRHRQKDSAVLYFILSAAWLIIGGGICASLMGA
ncbi:MAG TPA: hypothetical protein VGD40_09425 [Chryseosolibacter sp.]